MPGRDASTLHAANGTFAPQTPQRSWDEVGPASSTRTGYGDEPSRQGGSSVAASIATEGTAQPRRDRAVILSVGWLHVMLEGDDTRDTFTTEAQRGTEGAEEMKSL
jgi:hypothetical protein